MVVRLAGLEPTASAFAGLRSIQLSYKRLDVAACRLTEDRHPSRYILPRERPVGKTRQGI